MDENHIKLLTTRQFGAHVGVTARTVRRWIKHSQLVPHGQTPTGQYRFHPSQVTAILSKPELNTRANEIAAHMLVAREKVRRNIRRFR